MALNRRAFFLQFPRSHRNRLSPVKLGRIGKAHGGAAYGRLLESAAGNDLRRLVAATTDAAAWNMFCPYRSSDDSYSVIIYAQDLWIDALYPTSMSRGA